MPEPPPILDGARVLEFAPFDAQMRSSGRASVVVGGVAVDPSSAAGLAIVEDLARGDRFLLLCDDDWTTLTAEPCGDLASAKAGAERLFPGAGALWRPFRELTDAERREMDSTQAFLRELMQDEPDA